jgi:Ca2+-binding EF-hand superfamily protein
MRQREQSWLYNSLQEEFKLIDTDGDGKLSRAELTEYLTTRTKQARGTMTPAQENILKSITDKIFGQIDANQDQEISLEELCTFYTDSIINMQEDIDYYQELIRDHNLRSQ